MKRIFILSMVTIILLTTFSCALSPREKNKRGGAIFDRNG